MPGKGASTTASDGWTIVPDTPERFSSGIPHLDRLLGGGFPRGSMALLSLDHSVEPGDRELLLTPTILNFLYQSNGIIAVLPSRESPHRFRSHLTQWVSRKRFDTRVRVIDYVGEDSEAPYVVSLQVKSTTERSRQELKSERDRSERERRAKRNQDIEKMGKAEAAARGARSRMFLELMAFEIMEMTVGPQVASRMFLHGIKRTRMVGNLCLGLLRPGLGCADAVRGMADLELAVTRTSQGLLLRGIRPAFPDQLVLVDPRGAHRTWCWSPSGSRSSPRPSRSECARRNFPSPRGGPVPKEKHRRGRLVGRVCTPSPSWMR